MERIRINRNKLARGRIAAPKKQIRRREAALGDMGEPADIATENFETITGFKPSLDLPDAEHEKPPVMDANNPPKNMKLQEGDPNALTANELSKGDDYHDQDLKEEKPPHDGEGASQTSPKNGPGQTTASANDEYREKFMLSSRLADVKIAVGQMGENDRYAFVEQTINENSIDEIEKVLNESEGMYEAVKAAKSKVASRNPLAPNPMMRREAEIDPLQAIFGGI